MATNLREFTKTSVFQHGILSFIVNLKATTDDLEELNQMFLKLDTSKDGQLSLEEISVGLE